jgi:hypothetical protein
MYRKVLILSFLAILCAACGGSTPPPTPVPEPILQIEPASEEKLPEGELENRVFPNCRSDMADTVTIGKSIDVEHKIEIEQGRVHSSTIQGDVVLIGQATFGATVGGGVVHLSQKVEDAIMQRYGISEKVSMQTTNLIEYQILGRHIIAVHLQWYGVWQEGLITLTVPYDGKIIQDVFPYRIKTRMEFEVRDNGKSDVLCAEEAQAIGKVGDSYLAQGLYKEAIVEYEKASQLVPNDNSYLAKSIIASKVPDIVKFERKLIVAINAVLGIPSVPDN